MATTQQEELLPTLVSDLQKAIEKIRADREQFEKDVEAKRQSFTFREQMVQQSIEGLKMAFGGDIDFGPMPVVPSHAPQPEETPKLSISDKYLEKIQRYIADKGEVRQADIVSDLKLNSGTVSVGLRRLEMDSLVRKSGKQRGSQVWVGEQVESKGAEESSEGSTRETRIRPGEGVSEGRVKTAA